MFKKENVFNPLFAQSTVFFKNREAIQNIEGLEKADFNSPTVFGLLWRSTLSDIDGFLKSDYGFN